MTFVKKMETSYFSSSKRHGRNAAHGFASKYALNLSSSSASQTALKVQINRNSSNLVSYSNTQWFI